MRELRWALILVWSIAATSSLLLIAPRFAAAQTAIGQLRLNSDYSIDFEQSLPTVERAAGQSFERIDYRELGAVEWQVRLQGPASGEMPWFDNQSSADFELQLPSSDPVSIHWLRGSHGEASDFQPLEQLLTLDQPLTLQSFGGRSSDGVMPYFNLANEAGGLIVAIGWPGDWRATFVKTADDRVRIRAGLQQAHFRLQPAEQVRLPSVLILPYQGDRSAGQNRFRQLMLKHFSPTQHPPLELMPVAASVHGMLAFNDTSEFNLIPLADEIAQLQLPIDTFWLDAGWNAGGFPSSQGNPEADPIRFPHGLVPIGNHVRDLGFRFLAWFEPERVMRQTWLHREHPDWLLRPSDTPEALRYQENDGFYLFDLSQADAREWMLENISKTLQESEISIYRQDCNLYPSHYWQTDEADDEVGLREVRYVNGLYAFLDELAVRHPDLIIDNCAAGGRRLDFEMLRRSVCLWRSDSCWGDAAYPRNVQNMTLGLSSWLPLHGLGAAGPETYALRSGMGACGSFAINYRDPIAVTALRSHLQNYLPVRRLFLEDFYPLTDPSDDPAAWIAYQFHDPKRGEGIAQAFRGSTDNESTFAVHLKGLEPEQRYQLTSWDGDRVPTMHTGSELMTDGIKLHGNAREQQAWVLHYQRTE